MKPWILFVIVLVLPGLALAQKDKDSAALASSVQELRDSVGEWTAVTSFLKEDGSVARTVTGTYRFEWIVVDRVLSGKNNIPEMNMSSGILFYVNETKKIIEMVSVGADGNLWVMTGPLGSDTRYTQMYKTQDGGDGQLRFTRYNVTSEGFESKMEHTDDGGKTWKPGNHQVFRRK